MKLDSLPRRSSWRSVPQPKELPALSGTHEFETVIIGGGLTGILAAYLLREQGAKVALLERGRIGDWATGSTTAFLMEVLDTEPQDLVNRFGLEKARTMMAAHRGAIDLIEKIIEKEHIDCDFRRCPAYLYANDEKELEELHAIAEGFEKVGTRARFTDGEIGLRNRGVLRVENQAKFHPLKFLFALSERTSAAGVCIFEQTEVAAVTDAVRPKLTLKNGGHVSTGAVLMATHYPLSPQPAKLAFKKAWYTSYVLEALIPKGAMPEALFEDEMLPYHYLRVDPHDATRDRLIIGGEDQRSDLPESEEKSFERLEEYLHSALGDTPYEMTRAWKGRVVEPGDGIAHLGPLGGQVWYATGYSGNGMTYAAIAAQSFADFVHERANAAQKVFAADRPLKAREYVPKALEYIEEFVRGAITKLAS